jgi:hypothetical protein
MTEQRMNQVCAEVLGYSIRESEYSIDGKPVLHLILPNGEVDDDESYTTDTDELFRAHHNFCNDKNSHAALWEYIEANEYHSLFSHHMRHICMDKHHAAMKYSKTFGVVSAPAALLVEAFLRAVGRWEE